MADEGRGGSANGCSLESQSYCGEVEVASMGPAFDR
jgi:hypothetical protein